MHSEKDVILAVFKNKISSCAKILTVKIKWI